MPVQRPHHRAGRYPKLPFVQMRGHRIPEERQILISHHKFAHRDTLLQPRQPSASSPASKSYLQGAAPRRGPDGERGMRAARNRGMTRNRGMRAHLTPAAVILGGLSLLAATACGGSSQQPAARAAASSARDWWRPKDTGPNNGPGFQWELDHPLNIHSAKDMGYGALNAARRIASSPTVYDIDGIDNPASTVAALHRRGDKVTCYIEVGAAGNYYSAAQERIGVTYYAQLEAARDLGDKVPGYPERYLNINAASTVGIIKLMIRRQCAAKGFDAVEPDIDDSYTDRTGFRITEKEDEEFDIRLGAYAHSLGLAWGQKNGDNDPSFSKALEPTADFLLDEECNFYRTCRIVTPPYVKAGKLVLNAEYTNDWGSDPARDLRKFCTADIAAGIDGTLFTEPQAGQRNPCR